MNEPFARVEDQRLLTGSGRYTGDVSLPGQVFGVFVRSPHAHAEITGIDAKAALAQRGVLAVFTGDDAKAAGFGFIPAQPVKGPRGTALIVPPYPAMAQGRVRHVGQAVALVVAETPGAAQDAAELVEVSYNELPAVVDAREAIKPGAPQLHAEIPGNIAIDYGIGDKAATDSGFARAAHVVKLTTVNQRLVVCSMEPRAGLASYDAASDRTTLYVGCQGAPVLRDTLSNITKIPKEKLRLVTGDVGGGFGMKTPPYPEYLSLLLATRKIGKPVKWVNARSESFISDNQGRDAVISGELALDKEGKFLGLRIRGIANAGAFTTSAGATIATVNFAACLASVYATPALDAEIKYVVTNTVPVGPYRGAGRPEAAYIVERLVDRAAREFKIDPFELRRRNLIPVSAMPYKAPNGQPYDSGEFAGALDKAIKMADLPGYEARKRDSASRGRLRGRGIACYLEISAGAPLEFGGIAVVNGIAEFRAGGQSTGQGHETFYARLVAERLGLPKDRVRVIQGDTDRSPRGNASVGSRSTFALGAVAVDAVAKIIDRGKTLAALRLEASVADIEYAGGNFRVGGTDRTVSIWDLAEWARGAKLPDELKGGLEVATEAKVTPNYPNGCHVAEVEIDPDTGSLKICDYAGVDDCGTVADHVLADGQVQGGVVQSVGQVLLERAVYDRETGQLVTGSFMDYGLPRADDVPFIRSEFHEIACTTNPLGAKGVGEGGTTGALPALVNAILDALAPLGVEHIEVPATPERIWRAISDAKAHSA